MRPNNSHLNVLLISLTYIQSHYLACSFFPSIKLQNYQTFQRRCNSCISKTSFYLKAASAPSSKSSEDVIIIGGGISGLAAALTIYRKSKQSQEKPKITIIEKDSTIGGRVKSISKENFIYDVGFAVFIEEYPKSRQFFNYEKLQLSPFLPGAYIYKDKTLNKIVNPLKYPQDFLSTVNTPIISNVWDKVRLLPLIWHVLTKPINELLKEDNVDTFSCLKNKYQFSIEFINAFWKPFLQGIYFSPLQQQSSRMFHLALKMFILGNVSLPKRGMQAVPDYLLEQVVSESNDNCNVLFNSTVSQVIQTEDKDQYLVSDLNGNTFTAKNVIIATDAVNARPLLSGIISSDHPITIPKPPKQNDIICMYYALPSPPPIEEPILVLISQEEEEERKNDDNKPKINNLCFPTSIHSNYAAEGYSLCSVSLLATSNFTNEELSDEIPKQLHNMFPDISTWELKQILRIKNAQTTTLVANCEQRDFWNVELPKGLFVCGDYCASASLNGALESGEVIGLDVLNSL